MTPCSSSPSRARSWIEPLIQYHGTLTRLIVEAVFWFSGVPVDHEWGET